MAEERRTVLKILTGTVTAASAAIAVGPATAFVMQASTTGTTDPGQWLRVAQLEGLELDHPTKTNVTGTNTDAWSRETGVQLGSVWLIRDGERSVRAYSTACPHLGCAVELKREQFFCPCHDSDFDLRGARLTGPSPRGLDALEVRITDGWVYVKFQKFRQGTPEKIAL